jgi:Tol biopolymer transport system component
MKDIAGRLFHRFALLSVLAISISSLASAQGESHPLYFPFVLSTTISYPNTIRVSVAPGGLEANGFSGFPSISAEGRFVAFESGASNLVSGDMNYLPDIFVYDWQTWETERISLSSEGIEANAPSGDASISADGRYVAFYSTAGNLVNGDLYSADVFVHDRISGLTTRISIGSDGTQANGDSWRPSISGDGRYVAFESTASNLVPGDTNECNYVLVGNCPDIFVHDLQTGETNRVSVATGGTQADGGSFNPSISADGQIVVFESEASNLVDVETDEHYALFVHDRQSGETTRIRGGSDPCLNADGRFVAYSSDFTDLVSGDTNGVRDIFVHDRALGQTERVSRATGGEQGNGESGYPSISADGRFVAFLSLASNLVSGDTNDERDVFVHDRQTGETILVSKAYTGVTGNSGSGFPSISQDGRYVAFGSWASNLVSGDTRYCTYMNCPDVFVFDREGGNP